MRTLLLILFKILELAGLVASYFVLSLLGTFLILKFEFLAFADTPINWYHFYNFFVGFSAIFILAFVFIILYLIITEGIPAWIELNKEWVDKLLK